jgi:hypothetical protein
MQQGTVAAIDEVTSLYPGRRVSVPKIDVQGAGSLVLRGAEHTIAEHHPVLFVEVFQEGLAAFGTAPGKLVSLLGQLGYKPFTISARKAIASSASEIAEICRRSGYTDILFLNPLFHQTPPNWVIVDAPKYKDKLDRVARFQVQRRSRQRCLYLREIRPWVGRKR